MCMKCLFRKLDILLVFEVGKEFLGYWSVPICSLLGRPTPPDCSERTTTLFFAEIHFSPEVAGYFCATPISRDVRSMMEEASSIHPITESPPVTSFVWNMDIARVLGMCHMEYPGHSRMSSLFLA
jgi:hypothetical protein